MPKWKPLAVLVLSFLAAPALAQTTRPAELITPSAEPATQEAVNSQVGKPLVYLERGDYPVILSAPHGGRLKIPGSGVRTGRNILIPKGVKNTFTMAFDGNVDVIATTLADDIQRRTGHRPYVVIAYFTRRNVDANRTPEEAYEDDAGQAVYERYHDAIRQFRNEILEKYRRGLILDIHGHGRDPNTIIRGTADWTSDRHLVEEFGKESITGPGGLLGPLAAVTTDGQPTFKFLPPIDKNEEPEYAALNGGYITREYGSYAGGTFDAVQLELGGNIRKREGIPRFADALADGVVRVANRYLLIGKPTTQPATRKTE